MEPLSGKSRPPLDCLITENRPEVGLQRGIDLSTMSNGSTARGARAATRARWQTAGAAIPATYPSHGSGKNHPTMDGGRGALSPLAASFRLRATEARGECRVMSRGRRVKVLAEEVGWNLARG
jgi:hypothetical protein